MSLLVRSVAAALGRTRRIPHCRPLSGSAKQEVNAVLDEIKHSPTVTMEMVAKTMKSCHRGRQQIVRQNALRSWMFAATGIAGYCWGYSKVPQRDADCGNTDDEMKQRTVSLIK